MLQWLRSRRVEKRPDRVQLAGRVLFLTVDPDLVRRQLEGEDLAWRPGIALRDDISTDEITPAYICYRSEEHTSELQSPMYLVCRLLLEKKKICCEIIRSV